MQNRREFLGRSCRALSMTALATQMSHFGLVSTLLAQKKAEPTTKAGGNDYKALVCVFLNGGNDSNNMVVPKYEAGYADYSAARTAFGLAIPRDDLLSIMPTSLNLEFGLHPAMTGLHQLWNQQKLSIVCNVGTLVTPITKAQYLSGAPRPEQLFSHPNQVEQFRTAYASGNLTTGWGGRLADRTGNLNTGAAIPMITSIAGVTVFSNGETSQPLIVEPAPLPLNRVLTLDGFGTASDEVARKNAMQRIRMEDLDKTLVKATSSLTQQASNVSQQLSADPPLTVPFPATSLGNQLQQVAKIMKFRESLAMSRQIFFVQIGGFDTHSGQIGLQNSLLTQVSQALKAFYDETVAQGIESSVTTFTMSDFNRTLNPGGSGGNVGSDHGWAGHHLVMGGAVMGGDFYGMPTPNGTVFPTLVNSGPDDVSTRGRFLPTVSVEMYAATLARWFGLTEAQMPFVFPLINNFPANNMGFLV